MKESWVMLVVSIFLVCCQVSVASSGSEWELFKEKDGIKAYKRNVERSSFLETKSTSIIEADFQVVANVLADVPAYPEWMYECIESPLIEQPNKDHLVLYFVQHAPWPARDREVIIEALTETNLEKITQVTTLRSLKDYPYDSGRKDRVRVAEFLGKWELEYLEEGRTLVTYTAYSNPGGSLSASIANHSLKNITSVSMMGLKKMVKKSKYQVKKSQVSSGG